LIAPIEKLRKGKRVPHARAAAATEPWRASESCSLENKERKENRDLTVVWLKAINYD
jgi:hypothetical protein